MQVELDSIYSFHQLGQRDNQEDSRFPNDDCPQSDHAVFAVCDGVGGCDKGEVASATVCSAIGELTKDYDPGTPITDKDFQSVLTGAYKALDEASNSTNQGMGTTLTFLAFHDGGAMAAHIGDSRIYQIRPNEGIVYRSEDHSLVNALLRSGNISPNQVKGHPKGNVITRCMSANDGSRNRDDATVVNLTDIAPGDYFLLCTDGVTNTISDEGLVDLLSQEMSDKEKCDTLAEICKDSSDNNTAILIHIGVVTVDPMPDDENDDVSEVDFPEGSHVETLRLKRKEDSSHEISPKANKSMFKNILDRIFK